MFELVPSKYLQKVFEDKHFELTDFNKATLIWNMYGKTRDEKITALKELAGVTQDAVLKRQITQRIKYENRMLDAMRTNEGRHIYVVLDEDDTYCGFFSEYEMAYRYGINNAANSEAKHFQIDKQLIVTEENDFMVQSPVRTNLNLFPEDKKVQTKQYEGDAVSSVYCTAEGTIQSIWSNEMPEEEEAKVDPYRSDRFEFQFFCIPFEGTVGWQVRDIRDGSFGVLMQDTDAWNCYLRKISERNFVVDFSDIQVVVAFLTAQGLWSHEHINPIYLEPDHYMCELDDESKAKEKAMECFSEYWIRKKKDPQNLIAYEERAIESSKEYRDICFEKQIKLEKEKCGSVDRAKSIEELII